MKGKSKRDLSEDGEYDRKHGDKRYYRMCSDHIDHSNLTNIKHRTHSLAKKHLKLPAALA